MEDKKLNAGRVGLTMKDAWNASQSYEKLNCVSHNGRSWAAKKNVSAGVEPSAANSEFWQMMSDRGEQGIQGPVGPQGNSAFDGTGVELVNNLTQGGQTAALSAEQGKILKQELTELESCIPKIRMGSVNVSSSDVSVEFATDIGTSAYFVAFTNGNDFVVKNKTSKGFVVSSSSYVGSTEWCVVAI